MARKRKTKRRRQGYALRLPTGETTTPIKMSWAAKPPPTPKPDTAA